MRYDDEVDTTGVPRAHSVTVARCGDPACNAVHVVLYDEHDNPLAHAALSVEQMDQIQRARARRTS